MKHEDFIRDVKKNAVKSAGIMEDFEGVYEEDAGEFYDLQERVNHAMMNGALMFAKTMEEALIAKVGEHEFYDARDLVAEYLANNDIGAEIMKNLKFYSKK